MKSTFPLPNSTSFMYNYDNSDFMYFIIENEYNVIYILSFEEKEERNED